MQNWMMAQLYRISFRLLFSSAFATIYGDESIILCFQTLECIGAGSKIKIRTKASPSTVAARTGAAAYEESRESLKSGEVKTKVRKRLAIDPDVDEVDLENYQGVLGRPGVDFPVLTGIPKTNFTCKEHGNGYFADLETDCQVFHICDEGRKISFLCPNGTIFRQLDLICDWWFKVDCASSPSQYAESSETLARDKNRRLQQRKHLQAEFNVESLSGEPLKQIDRRVGKAFVEKNRRMDAYFSEPNPDSIESFEFIDVGRSKNKRTFEAVSSSGSKELQEVAETASFVRPRQLLNGYDYPVPTANGKPAGYEYPKPEKQISFSSSASVANPTDRTGKRLESARPTGFGFDPAPNSNNGGFEPKPFNTRPTEILSTTTTTRAPETRSRQSTTTASSLTTQFNRGSTTYQSSLEQRDRQEKSVQQFTTQSTTTTPRSTTAYPKTYSTAKKLTSKAKEAAFYTPTIPSFTNKATKETTSERTPKVRSTTPTPSVSEHAMEMMKTLQQLGTMENDSEKYQGQRAGLEVPPSSGPSALHSLALYFATTPVDQNSTEPTPAASTNGDDDFQGKTNSDFELSTEANTPAITAAHLSQRTVEQYQALFEAENKRLEPNNTKISFHDDDNDLDTENSRSPIYAAAGSPQIRELAQVFTHALSAYLQDPETFRKILSEIRPTEPPPLESNEIENRFNNQDVFHGQEASFAIPKTATTTSTTTTVSPTEDFEVLDFSDVTLSTHRQETTTTESPTTTTTKINVPVPVNRILPPFSNNAIDRTPGSDLIAETLENEANNYYNRQGKARDGFETTTDANPLAIEINGGLALSTTFPFESQESEKDISTQTESTYFPSDKSNKNKKVTSPYGKGVKPTGSAPLSKLEQNSEAPEQWGDEGTTTVFDTEQTPTPSPDLLPPYKSTPVVFTPSKYYEPPVQDDEESLQQSQSQSIFGNNGNSVKSSEKRGKSYFNYVTVQETESSTAQTTRFGDRLTTTTTETPLDTTTNAAVNSRGHFITRKITTLDDSSTPLPDFSKTTIPDTGKISPNSKTTVSYSIFLDPLTINDGLMESSETAKKANNEATYLPRDLTTESYTEAITGAPTFTVSTRTASVSTRRGKELNTKPTAAYNQVPQDEKDLSEQDFVTAMQKRANEMFGGLNDTQADHLMNVMKQADKNKNVRRLILLLIQTCDDDYNKTVEESRNALLNALIQMDTKDGSGSDIQIVKTRYGGERKTQEQTTEASPKITTYRSVDHNKYTSAEATVEYSFVTSTSVSDQTTTDFETTTSFPTSAADTTEQTTTDFPTTTTDYPTTFYSRTTTTTTTTTPAPTTTSRKPRTRTRTRGGAPRVQKSLGLSEDFVAESSSNYGTDNAQNKHSDARALELLRSLYSLASRWG
ncbi:mucin-2 [Culicoides brevitarsis]|uniref:mucin-2 n=1 Tax=Culicoides brevitarsis TaxID=469753 RepID=UPI00307B2A7F